RAYPNNSRPAREQLQCSSLDGKRNRIALIFGYTNPFGAFARIESNAQRAAAPCCNVERAKSLRRKPVQKVREQEWRCDFETQLPVQRVESDDRHLGPALIRATRHHDRSLR